MTTYSCVAAQLRWPTATECLNSIAEWNPILRALSFVDTRDAVQSVGEHVALHGLMVAVKDNVAVKGMPFTVGSDFYRDRVADEDAEVVDRLRLAGAAIFAKANLHEFALGPTTANALLGECRNAFDANRIPGGSSGGSAVAVASRMCAAALGTDTSGSIIIPSALNGLVGLRPTIGLVPNSGSFPVSERFDTIGPMALRVEDVARMFVVLSASPETQPVCQCAVVEALPLAAELPLGGMTFGIPSSWFFEHLHPEVRAAAEVAINDLRALGASTVDIDTRWAPRVREAVATIVFRDAAMVHRDRLNPVSERRFDPEVLRRLKIGQSVSEADYEHALEIVGTWRKHLDSVLQDVDAIVSPAVSVPAPPLHWPMDRIAAVSNRLTAPWAAAEGPMLTVPCGYTSAGLPVGMLLVTRAHDDFQLCRIAHAYEMSTHHYRRSPAWRRAASAHATKEHECRLET